MKHLTALACAALLPLSVSTACSETDPAEGGGGEAGAPSGDGPAYAFVDTVYSAEDRFTYLHVTDRVDVGELDPATGIEFPGNSAFLAWNGSVLVSDSEQLTIQRYDVDDDLTVIPDDVVLSISEYGVASSVGTFFGVSEERVYLIAHEALTVIVLNPKTMEFTGTIDLSSIGDISDLPSLFFADGTVVGDKVYVPFYFDDYEGGVMDTAVRVAVLSATENELLDVLEDDRCSLSNRPGSLLPNGDFYVAGESGNTGFQWYSNPQPSCLLRIRAGESDFDPDYRLALADAVNPLTGGADFNYVESLGAGVVWATEDAEFADEDTFYAESVWHPVLVDPTGEDDSIIIDSETVQSVGWLGEEYVIDGKLYFSASDFKGGGTVYAYGADGSETEQFTHHGWLQLAKRLR